MSSFLFKYDLAREYFPDVSPATARRLFSRELRHNASLWDDLLQAGYRPAQKRLTPRQVSIVFHYIGEP